jgi:hypothetical protein
MCKHTNDSEHILKLPGQSACNNECRIMHIHTYTYAHLHMCTWKLLYVVFGQCKQSFVYVLLTAIPNTAGLLYEW